MLLNKAVRQTCRLRWWFVPPRSRASKPKAKRASPPPAVPAQIQRERFRHIIRDFVISVLFTVLLIGAKDVFENTRAGGYLEDIARDWLQYSLARNKDLRNPKIVVVDISSFAPRAKHPYTPRDKLKAVVDAVSSHSPRAVGLDVNFSAEGDEPFFVPDEDPDFLDYCLAKRKKIADGLLFVGISSSVVKGPDRWLGSKQYFPLAAYIDHPNSESVGATAEMDEYIDVLHRSDGETQYWRLPSLGAAISHHPIADEPRLIRWAVEPDHLVEETVTDPFYIQHARFVVDFSRIDDFESAAILAPGDDAGLAALKTDNRFIGADTVIIGRGANADDSDRFAVPGHTKRYPGVFLHACAAYTLMQKNPLRLMTHRGRWAFDAAVSFLIFFPILMLRLHYNSRTRQEVASHRLNKIFTWSAIVLLFVVGVSMVNRTRIFWEDFPLVMIGLLLHSRLERGAEAVGPDLLGRLRSAWRSIAFTDHSQTKE